MGIATIQSHIVPVSAVWLARARLGDCGLCGQPMLLGELVRSVRFEHDTPRVVHEECFLITQELAKALRQEVK